MRSFLSLILFLGACKDHPPPTLTEPFRDEFERASVGPNWNPTSDVYRITGGQLSVSGAYNHPLWLRRKLPPNASIELDCKSMSDAGDIKVEAWGDGQSHATDKGAYTSTGYVFIMGGWHNSRSIIAKGNEHGSDVVSRAQPRVEPGQTYHWKIARADGRMDWFIDDTSTPFLSLPDPTPWSGPGHEFFAINDWESDLWFDNLVIRPGP